MRALCTLILGFAATVFSLGAPGASAQSFDVEELSSPLEVLRTGDDARGWEAVGRIDIIGKGFCTGALISADLVLTAAHCMYDRDTGELIDPSRMEFLAGVRDGRALAYRDIRRAVVHPGYEFSRRSQPDAMSVDLALLHLAHPIRTGRIEPFPVAPVTGPQGEVSVVSYAESRAEAPTLQEVCALLGREGGVFVMSCDIDFGSSGAPIFQRTSEGRLRIVSVVSAKAEMGRQKVALGADIGTPIRELMAAFQAGEGVYSGQLQAFIRRGGAAGPGGAKFVRP